MNPSKGVPENVSRLGDLPHIGPAMASDRVALGIIRPEQLIGQNPYHLFDRLCGQTRVRHDPCVRDVFISITRFMDGEAPRPGWAFTAESKQHHV